MQCYSVIGYDCEGVAVCNVGTFTNEKAAVECKQWHLDHPSVESLSMDFAVEEIILEPQKSFIPPMSQEEYDATAGKEIRDLDAYFARMRDDCEL